MIVDKDDRERIENAICGYKKCSSWNCPMKDKNGECVLYEHSDKRIFVSFIKLMQTDQEFRRRRSYYKDILKKYEVHYG